MKSMSNQVLSTTKSRVDMPLGDNAVKSLANNIFQQLQSEGCKPKDIINVSTQLLSLLTHELKKDEKPMA